MHSRAHPVERIGTTYQFFQQGYIKLNLALIINILDVFASIMVAVVAKVLIYKDVQRISTPLCIRKGHYAAG